MHSQMIVILEMAGPMPVSVDVARRVAARLLGTAGPKSEVILQRPIDGEVTPQVAFELTEAGATFTISGTSGRVYEQLWQLCRDDFGPGTRIPIDAVHTLMIKSCGDFPQPKPSGHASKDSVSSEAAFNHVVDAALKWTSLAGQAWHSP